MTNNDDEELPAYSAAPPPGPPPGHQPHPPPAQPAWDDNSAPAYPPPPGLLHEFSSAANATTDEADNAQRWCAAFPLAPPFAMDDATLRSVHAHQHTLIMPPGFNGTVNQTNVNHSIWRVTSNGCKDTLFQTALPAYSHYDDSPMLTERAKTIYFEIGIHSIGKQHSRIGSMLHRHNEVSQDSGIAIGFFAPPYPPFRLPGWQRGSLAVHSDDGRRYVGNDAGGFDFTEPFRAGETIGLGMMFTPLHTKAGPQTRTEVFFTRNGVKAGGWDLLHTDDARESIVGLRGECDIFPAIGVFGNVDVDVNFGEPSWLYRGYTQRT
ncbi:hypothetical protein BT63DRAFT_272873 [Microthyrium microscopicum]|uniref:SPRY domain-containing protein n=1 Tax=Microthyrium microscopicum TaxID=703497 RepID=A0A6A6U7Q3_9PEZI|nr:hypothetical protein BT63DRAFT_272873 [Microthyrium microscopicum]